MRNFLYIYILLFVLPIDAQHSIQKDTLRQIVISTSTGEIFSKKDVPKSVRIISAKEISALPVENIDELLENIAGMDIRTRGSKGVQSDISIRGGNFDQVLVLLNGIPVNNFQTGHHNLDLPVSLDMIQRIEVWEGASGQSFGMNAYSGVVNIITKKPLNDYAETGIKAGQNAYFKIFGNLQNTYKKISVYNGFTYQKSDGYLKNSDINNTDFNSIKDFLQILIATKNHPVNIQAGYQQKDFGANSFYTSKYPWQYEKTKGFFASVSKKMGNRQVFEPYLNYRLHFDQFQLFRESVYHYDNGYYINGQDTAQYAPGFYYKGHNFHKTQKFSGGIKTKIHSKAGDTYFHINGQNQKIWSNVLGETLSQPIETKDGVVYTKSAERNIFSLNISHSKKINDYKLGGGLNLMYSKKFKTYLTGGLYLSRNFSVSNIYISANSAVRLPTFTDLYYQGPSNVGNPDLQPEKSMTFEAGYKYLTSDFQTHFSVFYRKGEHTIDWVRKNLTDKWKSENITELNTFGGTIDFSKKFKSKFLKKIQLSYTYLQIDKQSGDWISKYALDYLKHKFVLNIRHQLFYGIQTGWQLIYKNRNGQYLDYVDGNYQLFDYKPYFLTHLKFSKKVNRLDLELTIQNLLDKEYRDLSYIKMPGRWIIFGLKYSFDRN